MNKTEKEEVERLRKENEELKEVNRKLLMENAELPAKNDELLRQNNELIRKGEILVEMNKDLFEKALKIDKLFSIIAHDLRNPVGNISGLMEVLVASYDKLSDEKRKYFLQIMKEQTDTVLGLLINLLSWSRLRIGQGPVSPINLHLKECGDNVINLLQSQAYKKQIELINVMPADLVICADSVIIETVFRNLIANAIKFTKPGGRVTLSTTPSGNMTQIMVSDTGVGIKKENVEKMFDSEFFSTKGTNKEVGTGLGLQLCQEMIKEQGGMIFVLKTLVGEGSTIAFTAKTAE